MFIGTNIHILITWHVLLFFPIYYSTPSQIHKWIVHHSVGLCHCYDKLFNISFIYSLLRRYSLVFTCTPTLTCFHFRSNHLHQSPKQKYQSFLITRLVLNKWPSTILSKIHIQLFIIVGWIIKKTFVLINLMNNVDHVDYCISDIFFLQFFQVPEI